MNIRKQITPWLLAIAITTSCALAPACDPIRNVVWPTAVSCGTQSADPVIDTVSTVLLQEVDPADELEELAREHGPELIACVVEQVVRSFMSQDASRMAAGYRPDPTRAAASERGRAFLAAKGVEVQR